MLRTITVGSCLSIQGLLVGKTPDGRLIVRVDGKTYAGTPVPSLRAA
jgi:hypothetical protein